MNVPCCLGCRGHQASQLSASVIVRKLRDELFQLFSHFTGAISLHGVITLITFPGITLQFLLGGCWVAALITPFRLLLTHEMCLNLKFYCKSLLSSDTSSSKEFPDNLNFFNFNVRYVLTVDI